MDAIVVLAFVFAVFAVAVAVAFAVYFPAAFLAGTYNPAAPGFAWAAVVAAVFLGVFALGFAAAAAWALAARRKLPDPDRQAYPDRRGSLTAACGPPAPLTIDRFAEIALC